MGGMVDFLASYPTIMIIVWNNTISEKEYQRSCF